MAFEENDGFASIIQADSEILTDAANYFGDCSQQIQRLYYNISDQLEILRFGGWEGESSQIFYASMDSDILLGLNRLGTALSTSQNTFTELINLFSLAEEEAAQCLCFDARNQFGRPFKRGIDINDPAWGTPPEEGHAVLGNDPDTYKRYFEMSRRYEQDEAFRDAINAQWGSWEGFDQALAQEENNASNPVASVEDLLSWQALTTLDETITDVPWPMDTKDRTAWQDYLTNQLTALNLDDTTVAAMVRGLSYIIQREHLDPASLQRLLDQASLETNLGYSPAMASLYAVALSYSQGEFEGWEGQLWEDSTGVVYFGRSGLYGNVGGTIFAGGNCTAFVSTSLLNAGVAPSDYWNLGNQNSYYRLTDAEAYENNLLPESLSGGLYEGSYFENDRGNTFAGVKPFRDIIVDELFSSDVSRQGYPYTTPNSIPADLGPGDLIFTLDGSAARSLDHVSIIVGWGDANGTAGSPFYLSADDARSNGVENPVPYAVDHGGQTPEDFPRPWTQTSTLSPEQILNLSYDVNQYSIEFYNLEPRQ